MDNNYEWEKKENRKSLIRVTKFFLIFAIIFIFIGHIHFSFLYFGSIRPHLPLEITSIMDLFFLKFILICVLDCLLLALSLFAVFFLLMLPYPWCSRKFEKFGISKIYKFQKFEEEEFREIEKCIYEKYKKWEWKIAFICFTFFLILIAILVFSNFDYEVIFSVAQPILLFITCSFVILLVLSEIIVKREYNISDETMQSFHNFNYYKSIFIVFYFLFSVYLLILASAFIYARVNKSLDPVFQNLVVTTSSALDGAGYEAAAESLIEHFFNFFGTTLHISLSDFFGAVLPFAFAQLISILIFLLIIPEIYFRGYTTFLKSLYIFSIYLLTNWIIQTWLIKAFFLPINILTSFSLIIVIYLSDRYIKSIIIERDNM